MEVDLIQEYVTHKKLFTEFMVWYKENKPKVSDECKEALIELTKMWSKASTKQPVTTFFDMKEYHVVINTELYKNVQAWRDYIKSGQTFRLHLMAQCYQKYGNDN